MITFENKYFKCENIDGVKIVTVLEDKNKFFGVDVTGCKFTTTEAGFIKDNFTVESLSQIYLYCNENKFSKEKLKIELRNRTLNVLIGMLS